MTASTPDAQAVAAAFGLGAALGPARFAARGELGAVYRLDTSTGPWAAKLTFAPPDEREAAAGAAFQDAAAAAGVPLPRLRRTLDGGVIGAGVRVFEWVELEPAGTLVESADAGRVLAAAHAVHWPAGPVDAWFREPTGPERLGQVAGELEPAGLGPLDALVAQLVAAEEVVRAAVHEPAEVCHRDVNPDNLLRRSGGGPILIDWDNAGPASPRQELASLLFEQCGDDLRAAQALHAAYVEAGGQGGVRVEDFGMAFAVQAHLFELYGRRFLDSPPGDDRERSAWRLRELAARPLTLARAEALVAAVSPRR